MKQRKNDLNKLIQEEMDRELDSGEIEKEIKEQTEKEVKKEITAEVDRRVRERLNEEIPPETPVSEPPKVFLKSFPLCWQSTCKQIFIVMIFSYIIIIALYLFCALSTLSFCTATGAFGISFYIIGVSLVSLLAAFLLALFSPQTRASLVFAFLTGLPMIILISLLTFRYIGLILVAFVILLRIIQGPRR